MVPNVPSFDHLPVNGRPRKLLPEIGKEFPLINGVNALSGASASQISNAPQTQQASEQTPHQQQTALPTQPTAGSQTALPETSSDHNPETAAEKEAERDGTGTAIFQPGANWKQELKDAHEKAQKQGSRQDVSAEGWGDLKEEESVMDEEDSVSAEGEGVKTWKSKKTLRK